MFTRVLLAVVFLLSAVAPVVAQPGSSGSGNAWVSLPITLTDDIYWAAQNPALQALRQMPSGEARDSKTQELARAGFLIDYPIHVNNWSPSVVMYMRALYGFTWVNNAMEPQGGGNGPVPPGKIKVSIDAKDYPEWPKPQPPTPDANFVGRQLFGNIYTYGGSEVKDGKFVHKSGDKVTENGLSCVATQNQFAVGTQFFWTCSTSQ